MTKNIVLLLAYDSHCQILVSSWKLTNVIQKNQRFIKYLLFNNPTTLFLQLSLLSIHPTLTGPNGSSTDPNEGAIPLDSSQQHYNLEAGRPTHSSLGKKHLQNLFSNICRITKQKSVTDFFFVQLFLWLAIRSFNLIESKTW